MNERHKVYNEEVGGARLMCRICCSFNSHNVTDVTHGHSSHFTRKQKVGVFANNLKKIILVGNITSQS